MPHHSDDHDGDTSTDRATGFGRADGQPPHAVLVHFLGGPWHDRKARYAHLRLHGFPHMHCPGGRYHFVESGDDGLAIYAFTPA